VKEGNILLVAMPQCNRKIAMMIFTGVISNGVRYSHLAV